MNTRALIAANLKRLMRSRGLTQQRLADLAGVRQGTVSAIATGAVSPTVDTLAALASVLEISPREFFSKRGEMGIDATRQTV